MSNYERLTDRDIAAIIEQGDRLAFPNEIHLLAKEVREWRASYMEIEELTAAFREHEAHPARIPDPAAETLPTPPNPYRFTVWFSPTPTHRAWAVRIYEGDYSMQLMELCDTPEEAEHHASLILSALHHATREDQ